MFMHVGLKGVWTRSTIKSRNPEGLTVINVQSLGASPPSGLWWLKLAEGIARVELAWSAAN